MAISKKNDVLRDIYSMVRKGAVQFELGDRVPVQLRSRRTGGEPVTYYVGGVSWDHYSGRLSYSLYDGEGNYVPSATGFRDFSSLETPEAVRVREAVSSYLDRSLCRIANMNRLHGLVSGSGGRIVFSGDERPDVYLDMRLDGVREKCSVDMAWVRSNDSELLARVTDFSGRAADIKVSALTDMGLSNVLSHAGSIVLPARDGERQVPVSEESTRIRRIK